MWKVYIPSSIWKEPKTTILIGWIDNINHNIIVISYTTHPIECTNDDYKRNLLLQKVSSINQTNNNNQFKDFQCMVIGSTNIAKHDCSDLMRIYKTNAWIQCDKYLNLKQVLTLNKNDKNGFYMIQYHSIDSLNLFSPYYTANDLNNDSSYNEILKLCNQTNDIHLYLHHHKYDKRQKNYKSFSCFAILCYILLQYFQIINTLYGIFYGIIVYIPPLFILSECRIVDELTLNNAKFGNIIKYLKSARQEAIKSKAKKKKSDRLKLDNKLNFNNIHQKRVKILDIWSDIFQHFINLLLGFIFGYFLYFYISQQLEFISPYLKLFDYNSIKCYISWLMGIPIGLKLNTNLNDVFGKLSLLCLEIIHIQIPITLKTFFKINQNDLDINNQRFLTIWDVFDVNDDNNDNNIYKVKCDNNINSSSLSYTIITYLPLIKIYLSILSCCFGITFMIAMISDIISILSLPFELLFEFFLKGYELEARMLSICAKLFRGLKYNQLRRRVDKCQFDTDQLFVGVILFAIFTFLLPTVVVYFVYFSITMIYIWTFQLILQFIQITIHYLSISSIIFLLIKPKFICSGYNINFDFDNDNDDDNHGKKENNLIKLETVPFSIIKYLKQSITNKIVDKINKDIKHKKFIQSLKISMYHT